MLECVVVVMIVRLADVAAAAAAAAVDRLCERMNINRQIGSQLDRTTTSLLGFVSMRTMRTTKLRNKTTTTTTTMKRLSSDYSGVCSSGMH